MSAARPSVVLMGDTLNFGGTEGQFVEVACGLDRTRWDLDVACIRAEGPLRARLDAAGIEAWSCGRGSFKSPRFLGAVRALARRLRSRRVRIVHSFDFYSNVLGVPAARMARVPVIIASQRDLGNLRPPLQRRLQRAMLFLATHVLVNSHATAECLAHTRAARSGRLSVIHNGVDLSRFGPAEAAIAKEPGVTVTVLANLRPEKGILQVVEAAEVVRRAAPRVHFDIWGEGSLRGEIEARIRALALEDTVRLRGSTRTPEDALRRSDIFVLPSLSEASSNVILEAMATGLPVVATRIGGTPALVGDAGLLVPAGDPPALAAALLDLVRNPATASRLGAAARTRALAEFGMNRMLERVEALYRQLLASNDGSRVGAPAMSRP
jgi:glycosyltransferase involved in cell wall biosynthesis